MTDGEANKNTTKDDSSLTAKGDDKLSNNPLLNLAIAVNSISNGITEDLVTASTATPVSTNSKQALPKALVKPQVLTHVIEGFVIQEGMLL